MKYSKTVFLTLLVCVFSLSILAAGCKGKKRRAATPSYNAIVQEDAWVDEWEPYTNFGWDIDLYAGYCDGYEENIFLYFDVSPIPAMATVVSAELWLHIWDTWNSQGAAFVFSLEDVWGVWYEMAITWYNAPITAPICTFAGPPHAFEGWLKITHPALTALVQDWVSYPALNNGLAILPGWVWSLAPDDGIDVDSIEWGLNTAPYLRVYYR